MCTRLTFSGYHQQNPSESGACNGSFSKLESKRTTCSTYDLPGSPRSFIFPLTHIQMDHSDRRIAHPQDGIVIIEHEYHCESPLQQKWPKSLLHSTSEQTGCIRLQTSQLSTTLAASAGQGGKNSSGAKVNVHQSIPTCHNVLAKLSNQHDRSSRSKLEQICSRDHAEQLGEACYLYSTIHEMPVARLLL